MKAPWLRDGRPAAAAAAAGSPRGDQSQAPDVALPDGDLILAARAGDYGAFEVLVQRYHERVHRLAFGLTKSEAEAEEAVQETFLSLFRNLHRFEGRSALGSWLYRIAVNAVLMGMRRRRRKPLLLLEESPREGDRASALAGPFPSLSESIWPAGDWARQPEAKLLSRELGACIQAAIADLPDKYRLVLLLRDVDGQSNDEVAHTLGLTVPTVKARLHRSRLLVRQALERYFAKR
jgi:RNA polymerase sigma-70 factor (ECF subfamily)